MIRNAAMNAAILHHEDNDADLLIIVTCFYLYLVCLVCRVLKNTYFKEHLSGVASKYIICDTRNNT